MTTPLLFRRLSKSKGLRFINLAGLSILFACLLVSYAHIRWELSYDKMFKHSEQVSRLSIAYDGEQPDGRIYMKGYDQSLKKHPEIEDILRFSSVYTGLIIHNGEKHPVENLYIASNNFFKFFDVDFVAGTLPSAFDTKGKIVISDKLAMQIFGRTNVVGQKIGISSRRYGDESGFVAGVYKHFPQNAHLHPNIIVCNNVLFDDLYAYYYVKLAKGTDRKSLAQQLTKEIIKQNRGIKAAEATFTPVTDIHLHSRILRELEPNGNIDYVYLIAGANVLLLVVVFFNLWLNSHVIFSSNRRYYYLLRINGANSSDIFRAELQTSCVLGVVSLLLGVAIAYSAKEYFDFSLDFISTAEKGLLALSFLLSVIVVSALPCIAYLLKRNISSVGKKENRRFSYSGVKYMLVVQYSIVLFILILSLVIQGQMTLIQQKQIGASNDSILVMKEQPGEVIQRFDLLKEEAERQPDIEIASGAMQLPGSAIRDGAALFKEGTATPMPCPLMVVGEDFFSFFNIQPIAGNLPPHSSLSMADEDKMMTDKFLGKKIENHIQDNYVINQKLLKKLGYSSPEEAIGEELRIEQENLDYIPTGKICAVVPDFIYANVFEDTAPLLLLQRKMFTSCFMFRFAPGRTAEGLAQLKNVWKKVNSDYTFHYSLLSDTYKTVYQNEINAQHIVNLFSLLNLVVTLLGLLVFMSFMVKARTREIAIRKVNGASEKNIQLLLNKSFLLWILAAFALAVPLSIYVANRWLANFAFKTPLHWWIFAGAGIFATLLSIVMVSWQSLRAARINPVESLKKDLP
ncbi:MAG: hypothetical protein H6Q14_1598 [Bacteroidetes bacterium]|nr:hypothetical protein [Bacteroidota bacterium]